MFFSHGALMQIITHLYASMYIFNCLYCDIMVYCNVQIWIPTIRYPLLQVGTTAI